MRSAAQDEWVDVIVYIRERMYTDTAGAQLQR